MALAAKEILKLFDSCWFEQDILASKQCQSIDETKPNHEEHKEPKIMDVLKVRSQSENLLRFETDFSSGTSLTHIPQFTPPPGHKKRRAMTRKRLGANRSLSELELEELKGFMDLGFVFTEEAKCSSLVTVIPGLQRLGSRDEGYEEDEEEESNNENAIRRPYLSEAWSIMDQRKIIKKLVKWRFPPLNNETNMKDNLKFWAQTVASAVR